MCAHRILAPLAYVQQVPPVWRARVETVPMWHCRVGGLGGRWGVQTGIESEGGDRCGYHRIKPYLGFGVPIGSAYLSARRTFGRPIGRPKVRFNPSPPPCFGRKNGRRYARTFGRPSRPAEGTV